MDVVNCNSFLIVMIILILIIIIANCNNDILLR